MVGACHLNEFGNLPLFQHCSIEEQKIIDVMFALLL